jgi:acylphosphatase
MMADDGTNGNRYQKKHEKKMRVSPFSRLDIPSCGKYCDHDNRQQSKNFRGIAMEENTRVHLIVSGRVQGVFFRAETQQAAARFGVSGWVRNKRDGTVEAVAEGKKNDVMSLIEWCKTGPPLSRVERVNVTWQDYLGKFSDFSVRY